MISTNDEHEVEPFPFMKTPGFRSWRTVGLDTWNSYFLLNYAIKDGRTWVSQGMLLWCEQDLLGFCNQARASSSKKISQITKLVPPEPTQAGTWTPIAIKEIWRCSDSDEQGNLLFVANDEDQQAALCEPAFARTDLQQMEKVFAAALHEP